MLNLREDWFAPRLYSGKGLSQDWLTLWQVVKGAVFIEAKELLSHGVSSLHVCLSHPIVSSLEVEPVSLMPRALPGMECGLLSYWIDGWVDDGWMDGWMDPAQVPFSFLLLLLFFGNVYLFLRETETDRVQIGEGQREEETQNLKQAPGSELSAQSPRRGSNLRTARS